MQNLHWASQLLGTTTLTRLNSKQNNHRTQTRPEMEDISCIAGDSHSNGAHVQGQACNLVQGGHRNSMIIITHSQPAEEAAAAGLV